MIQLLPASRETYMEIMQEAPSVSFKAIVAVEDGEVLGIVGIRPDVYSGHQWMFMQLTERIKKEPRALIKAGRIVRKWVRDSRVPTRALCDDTIPHAEDFLKHFGFVEIGNRVFSCQNMQRQ